MQKILNELRLLLTQIAEGKADPVSTSRHGIELLDQIATTAPVAAVRGVSEIIYVVEKSNSGETLAERRKGGKAQPFRCPKSVYDALVQVMASGERALPLDELLAAVGEVLGDQPPDFQVRVPLRAWLSAGPPLIVRTRARYRPVDATTFAAMANELWISLRK